MDVYGAYKTHLNLPEDEERTILELKGALEIPPQDVQDELIDAFFAWVAPVLPVVNQRVFLSMYKDPLNPPSLLLLQAIFLAGSRVVGEKSRERHSSSAAHSSVVYLQRAKALYDAEFEKDHITVVQSLLLMSWYWQGTEDTTENGLFYWSRLAIGVAQNFGMHKSNELEMSLSERRLWRRIWWTLYTRDRAMAAAYGRPISIDADLTNVDPITQDDFIEGEGHQPDSLMDLVVGRRRKTGPLIESEFAQWEIRLSQWMIHCPEQMHWSQSRHSFWPAILHSIFYTMVCQLHALLPAVARPTASSAVALQAGSTIASIMQAIVSHGQVTYVPPSVVLTVLSAAKRQNLSSSPTLILQWRANIETCLQVLELISTVWPIARSIREGAGLIYSENYFDSLLNEALTNLETQSHETQVGERRRKRYTRPRRANPDLLLPKSRIIVKISPGFPSTQRTSMGHRETSPYSLRSKNHLRKGASNPMYAAHNTSEACSAYPDPADVLQSLQAFIGMRQGLQGG
ncbi:fungal-specific transcription factor domain-containing protein [Aspergillus pseudocaelatus]|uniref:Fungal-specific transcription factor domain-containing protein n=1 Tax=Aspergillus pseudocaelatus TaxID=1825620 RepID=A0ABQ6WFN0_9EURO|nr:fungal-specific transcription factor domain-containing protein [Aspergillus pseudocaelatus]